MRTSTTVILLITFSIVCIGQQLDSLRQQLKSASSIEKPKILIALCDGQMNYDNNAALIYAEQAITASKEVKDSASLVKAKIMRGELLTVFDRFIESKSELEEALSIAASLDNQYLLSDIHGALGSMYFTLFDHERSLYHYKISIDLAREINEVRLLVKNMNNMANLFEVQGDHDLALKAFVECTQALEGTQWEKTRVYYIALLNSGMVSNSMGDHSSAVKYLKQALNGFRNLNIKGLEIHTLVGLVQSYTKLGKLDSALSYHQLTLLFKEGFEMASRKHFRDQTYAELRFEMKKYQDVISLAKSKLAEIGKDTNFSVFAANAAEIAYKSYKVIGNDKQALKYLELFNEYNNYMQSKKTEEEVKSYRTRFETELDFEAKKREILELHLREDIQQKEIEKQKYWRNSIMLLSLLGLIISLLILNSLKLKKRASEAESNRLQMDNSKLQMEVEHKNRELTSTAMFVAQKNQMLMNLQDHISKIFDANNGFSKKDFRTIQGRIKENIRLKEDWNKIKLHFEEVYPDFFKNLKAKCPELTPLELKHCAYIKMSLSVKEVARMLHVAPKSVQMSHYRLKKKLELNSEESLSGYLAKF